MRLSSLGLAAAMATALVFGCGDDDDPGIDSGPEPDVVIDGVHVTLPRIDVERRWRSEPVGEGCTYASPLLARSGDEDVILAVDSRGTVRALDPQTGDSRWSFELPRMDGHFLDVLATPGLLPGRNAAVLAWQELEEGSFRRVHHTVAVLDLDTQAMHEDLAAFRLEGEFPGWDGTPVAFLSEFQLLRSAIQMHEAAGTERGYAYISVGNGPSIQPFHGWVFQVDMDAWARGETPVIANFNASADSDCGPLGNRRPDLCGAGIWNAAGVQFYDHPDGSYDVLAATGNGAIDFDRDSYAYSLLRLGEDLSFDRGCDEELCADFDETDPAEACLTSCRDVFVAHVPEGTPFEPPSDGTCDGMNFTGCLHALDGDLGASMPVVLDVPEGPRVVVQPGKDGGIYLLDYENLGTLYQRMQLMPFCGTPTDMCRAFWIGTLVTLPAVTTIDGDPVVVVASVMADRSNPSGITALRVVMQDGAPRLEVMWQVPDFESDLAREVFRHHPGRPIMVDVEGEPFVFVVETRRSAPGDVATPPGVLWAVRVRDGFVSSAVELADAGQRFAIPLVVDDMVYVSSCNDRAEANGRIEAYQYVPRSER